MCVPGREAYDLATLFLVDNMSKIRFMVMVPLPSRVRVRVRVRVIPMDRVKARARVKTPQARDMRNAHPLHPTNCSKPRWS